MEKEIKNRKKYNLLKIELAPFDLNDVLQSSIPEMKDHDVEEDTIPFI